MGNLWGIYGDLWDIASGVIMMDGGLSHGPYLNR